MIDITVVILTYNEEKHIERCLKSLSGVVKRIVVVDSFSTDNTRAICERYNVDFYQNAWINYATQFQWALDNCNITTDWTMRFDADEYLEEDLRQEIINKAVLDKNVNSIYIKRKVIYKGKWIRFGGFYPQVLLRIWRTGLGRIEQRWMDEHIVVESGSYVLLKGNLVDENLNNIGWWINKHNNYATREMIDLLVIKYGFSSNDRALSQSNDPQARLKRFLKEKVYVKLPAGLRAGLYFLYRYILRLGFLDGYRGFEFHFLQGFWYRLVVDIKVREIESLATNTSEIPELIKKHYEIEL